MKLSLIIPLYNTEKHIEKCLLSTQNQDLAKEDYEVIIVDDGSTDRSVDIAKSLARKYPNIIIHSKKNEGVSAARNDGVRLAQGKYILFIDADDYLFDNSLNGAIEFMEANNLDILAHDTIHIDGDDNVLNIKNSRLVDINSLNGTETKKGAEYVREVLYFPALWSYIFKKQLFIDHNLKMQPYRFEDEEFIPRILYYAEKVKFYPERIYKYRHHADSFMKTHRAGQMLDLVKSMTNLNEFALSIMEESPEVGEVMRQRASALIFSAIKDLFKTDRKAMREVVGAARESGLMPLYNFRNKRNVRILNKSTDRFILYCSVRRIFCKRL